MPKENLTIDNLGDLGGGEARSVINAALAAATRDLDERGHEDQKTRKVVITVLMDKLDNGATAVKVEAIAKVPNYKTATTIRNICMGMKGPEIVFRPDNPGNPDQTTFDDHLPSDN